MASSVFSALGSVIGGLSQADSIDNVTQNAQDGLSNVQGYYNNYYNNASSSLSPYSSLGTSSINNYQNFLNQQMQNYGKGQNSFTFDQGNDPEFNFLLNTGLAGISSQAAAMGGTNSGAVQQALNNYAQKQALDSYQSEFSNWLNTQNLNNQTSSLLGSQISNGMNYGLNATNQLNNAGLQQANGLSGAYNNYLQTINNAELANGGLFSSMFGGIMGNTSGGGGLTSLLGSGSGGSSSGFNMNDPWGMGASSGGYGGFSFGGQNA